MICAISIFQQFRSLYACQKLPFTAECVVDGYHHVQS